MDIASVRRWTNLCLKTKHMMSSKSSCSINPQENICYFYITSPILRRNSIAAAPSPLKPIEATCCDSTMKFGFSVVTVLLLAAHTTADAFVFPTMNEHSASAVREQQSPTTGCSALRLTPQDLTDMMAKAHEEKIRAMKDIEEKKNTEIQVNLEREVFVV
jgi:hypothetical protein